MTVQPSIAFIVVNRAGEMSPMMATSDFLKRSEAGIGFWRIRVKSKSEHKLPVHSVAPASQGGEATLLSSPKQPAALAKPSEGGEPVQSTPAKEPSAPERRVAAPPTAVSNPAGGGAKLSKAERDAGIVADYLAGAKLSVIRDRYGVGDGSIYPVLAKAGVGVKRNIRSRVGPNAAPPASSKLKPVVNSNPAGSVDFSVLKDAGDEQNRDHSDPRRADQRDIGAAAAADGSSDPSAAERRDGCGAEDEHLLSGGPDQSGCPADVAENARPLTPASPAPAPKPKFRDWITQRKEEIADASAYLKARNIVVSVSNPHAEIKMFRLSDRGGTHYHESVLDAARELGWKGLV